MRSYRAAAARARPRPGDEPIQPAHCPSGLQHARSTCTSEQCPMAQILQAMPHLCAPEPPREAQPAVSEEDRAALARFAAVKPYADTVWGPAAWTALQADILSLPKELDAHEFCMFKVYLALRARYLPCSACALHFERHLREMPNHATMRTRAGLLRWLTTVQNDVNRRKQRQPLPEDEVLAKLREKAARRAEGEAAAATGGGGGEGEEEQDQESETEVGAEEEEEQEERQGQQEGEEIGGAASRSADALDGSLAANALTRGSPSATGSAATALPLAAAIPLTLAASAAVLAGALYLIRSGRRSRASRRSRRP